MLTLYLTALAIGGTLLVATLLFGGDADDVSTELEAELEAEVGADGHADHDTGGADADFVDAWLPISSLRFWTFFLAFFGLTGTLLRGLNVVDNAAVIGVTAGAIGWASGVAMIAVYRRLHREVVDSSLSTEDYVGATGTVVLPIEPGGVGKVRLELKGRTVEMLAETEDDERFAIQQSVLVLGVNDDGRVMVSRSQELQA